MSNVISGNMVGSYSPVGQTFIINDANGNEIVGVVTENVQVFDATPADVKLGKTFAYDGGVGVGTDTRMAIASSCVIAPGAQLTIPLSDYDAYDYTKFQAVITVRSSNYSDSATIVGYVLNDSVFLVGSSTKVSSLSKNANTKSIDFNINNDSNQTYEIHYFTYREE
jgi:hypothetical protein